MVLIFLGLGLLIAGLGSLALRGIPVLFGRGSARRLRWSLALIAGGLLSGTLIDEAWQGITAEVNSHFLDRYRQLLGGRSHARAPRARPFRTGTPHPPTFAEDANISRLPDRHSERVFSPPPRRKATGSDAAGIPHVISLDALYDADRVADAW